MTPERWTQVKALFNAARDVDEGQRASLLAREAAGDRELIAEVESLLRSHDLTGDFLDGVPARMRLDALATDQRLGHRVGAYRLVELIGSGGMGDVFRAVRDDNQYQAEVAVKLLRSDTGISIAERRFRSERQILATLDHRNIARLLDGGTTESGVPYLVMELVAGETIDRYCESHDLDVRARLRLFLQVCSAVSYAHQRLVVHRDLKPTNILVTAGGSVKLLDFGVAKLLETNETGEIAEQTRTHLRAMTLEYASPEQITGASVTTVSDVYSLGVVLYRLLTGTSPYRSQASDAQRMAEILGDFTPALPSAVSAPGPARRIDAELDDILLMALRKEPDQRYGSVEQFANDLRAHLGGLPVAARGNALRYRFGKFVRRHRFEITAGAAVLLALVAGLSMAIHEARVAERERLAAQRHSDSVRNLANTLVFEIDDSLSGIAGSTPARKLVVQRAQEYLESLSRESASDPVLLREIAVAYYKLADVQGDPGTNNLGDEAGALASYRKAAAFMEAAARIAPDDPDNLRLLARCHQKLARALLRHKDVDEANAYLQKSLQVVEPFLATHPADTSMRMTMAELHEHMAVRARDRGKYEEALSQFRNAHSIFEQLLRDEPDDEARQKRVAFTHKYIGAILIVQEHHSEALQHYQAAREIEEAQLARDPLNAVKRYNITSTYNDTGFILSAQGDIDAALEYYEKSYRTRLKLLEADPENFRMRNGLAYSLAVIGQNRRKKKDYEGAIRAYNESLALRESMASKFPSASNTHGIASAWQGLGQTYLEKAKLEHGSPAARHYCRQSSESLQKSLRTYEAMEAELQNEKTNAANIEEARGGIAECERILAAPR